MKTEFSSHLKSILWEYDIDALDFHDNIVIERILKFGEMEDYQALEKHIGRQSVIDFFMRHRAIFDKKTLNFWEKIFNIPHLSCSQPSIYEKMNKPLFCRGIR